MDDSSIRIFGCDIIQEAGIQLKLPQIVMTTAQMLFQRVYHSPDYTFEKYHLDVNGMAALFLAAKIEEYPKKAREVIEVFSSVVMKRLGHQQSSSHSHSHHHSHRHHHHHSSHKHRNQSQIQNEFKLSTSEYDKLREELITAERRLLKNLGFNLLSSYPHKIIVNYYHAIVRALDAEHNFWTERDNNRLLQIAWNYCNDSLRTDVFIKYNEVAVACACIQMACEDTQMLFPLSTDGKVWYLLFADALEVEAATKIIRDLYSRKKPDPRDMRRYITLVSLLKY